MVNNINKIAFGGAALSGTGKGYGFGDVSDTKALIHYAFDLGIELFDTAPIYGFHKSERELGNGVKDFRDKIKIISKAGVDWHANGRVNMSNGPKVVTKMLENSLSCLGTDYIDIYMIHWPDKNVDIRYPLEILTKAQLDQKIISIGLCNTTNEDLEKAAQVCEIEYLQSEVNLFFNRFEALNPFLTHGKITMGWGTLDKGILAGTVYENRTFDPHDCRSWAPWWKKSNWKERAKKAKDIEAKLGVSIRDLAIQYAITQSDYALCGAKSREQLDQITSSVAKEIAPDMMEKAIELARS